MLGPEQFDYELPEDLIAQVPVDPRDASRLMVLPRGGGPVGHRVFAEIASLLRPGDCLVLNDTRVFPARLRGTRPGGGRAEILLVSPLGEGRWRALIRPSSRLAPGRRITVPVREGTAAAEVTVVKRLGNGEAVVHLSARDGGGSSGATAPAGELVQRLGEIPLPPYIRGSLQDRERYQTVYARHDGSVAAPTAGLHFTLALLEEIAAAGVEVARITLHVGPGTFRPVRAERLRDHRMHPEEYEVGADAAAAIRRARSRGGRVVAVGTTVARALEAAALPHGRGGAVAPGAEGGAGTVTAGRGRTDLFIYPGYRFQVVDALITNFHLPRSTLLMLVSAFAGRERVLGAYAEAVDHRYRFYSFGDAMIIH